MNKTYKLVTQKPGVITTVQPLSSIIDKMCFRLVEAGKDASVTEAIVWFVIAFISMSLSAIVFHFFVFIKRVFNTIEIILINLIACHLSVGLIVQVCIGMIYIKDTCLLRAICHTGTLIMTNCSVTSMLCLTWNQLRRLSKIGTGIGSPEPLNKAKSCIVIGCIWAYCLAILLLKVTSPSSHAPIALILVMTLALLALYLITRRTLKQIRAHFTTQESGEERDNRITSVHQISEALKMVLLLHIITTLTWLPASLITLVTRIRVIEQTTVMNSVSKVALRILFLPPLLDPLCLLLTNRRMRRSFKNTIRKLFYME